MSVREIIAQVGGLLSGRVEQAVLLAWFNEIELMVQMQLFGISRADAVQYTKETIDATPIVEGHYQRVYSYWLLAKGHSRLQNTSGYERNRKLYISEYEAYRKWVIRTHGVTQAEKDRNGGYWSAYGIACKHGFVGSEQEWLQSLHGRDGADGLPGPQGAPGKDGKDGKDGRDGKDGKDGADGAQAGEYDLAYDTATHTLQLLCNKQSVRSFDLTQNGSTVYVQTACKALVCTKQDDARVTYTWSSDASGGGSATYIVNGKAVASEPVEQGEVCFSAGAYLQDGRNHLCVRVCDGQGSTAELDIWVNVVTLHVSSSLVADQPITGEITVRYAVAGLGQKTVYFLVDGQEVGTRQAEQPGKQQSFLLGTLSHGAHVLEIYASTFVGEQEVRSNTLHYELLCVQPDHTAPIIASCFHTKQIAQYAHLRIPYWVYLPDNLQSAMEVWVDGVQASTLRLPPYRGEYEYVCDQSGEHCVTFRVGQTTREFRFTVTEAQREARVETDDLMLWLDASGRNNAEETPARWSYRNAGGDEIQAAFSGFDWIRDGWQRDVSGVGYLRIPKGGRVCVPLAPFTREAREQGVTVEVLLAIRNVADRNAVVMQCVSGTGLEVRASRASLISEQTTLSCSLGDEQILHLCFVVRPEGEGRLMQIFVDGVLSAVAQYGVNDYWAQRVPAELTLGGDDCSTDVYMLRVYQNALRASGVVGNYASCASSAGTVTAALERNAVCGENGEILPATLPAHASYVLLKAQSLPTQQGMARSCSGSYQSGAYPELSCSFANAELEADAEGDMILYLLGGATASDGAMREGILLRPYSIPGKELRLDAHMRNSDGTANAALISLYDQVCPFESAAQKQDARYASGPDAIPISVFWQNEQTGEVRFVGKYNLCYETSCPENFGYVETELPRRQIWRALNDVSERVLFQSADFSGTDWKRDFVSEFPVGFADVRDLARLVDWVASCNPDAATEQALPVACTLDGVEYTQDSAAYRLAKFRTEVEEYFDLSDLVWYYLFTELFLCVEARAKQMRLATDDGERWYFLPWDFSASLGADARGVMRFDYSVLESVAELFLNKESDNLV